MDKTEQEEEFNNLLEEKVVVKKWKWDVIGIVGINIAALITALLGLCVRISERNFDNAMLMFAVFAVFIWATAHLVQFLRAEMYKIHYDDLAKETNKLIKKIEGIVNKP